MKYALLTLKLLVYAYLGYLAVFLATEYDPTNPAYSPPFIIFIIDTVNLFIHEAGHLFFRIFGMWMYMLGGSAFQVLLPAALLTVTVLKRAPGPAPAAFWVGENMVNVSVYIKDAPTKHLKLIASGLIHDWNWLLSGNLDAAEPLGTIVQVCGLAICFGSVVAGVWLAVKAWRESPEVPDRE